MMPCEERWFRMLRVIVCLLVGFLSGFKNWKV